jgi:conserved oligomeric Golgi complex subunit 2
LDQLDSASASSDDDVSTLPFAAPLNRTDFLSPAFSPSEYLSSLRNRHQTLEDLRSELRARSQELSKELLDLVNSNYTDFLSLGQSLKSGDEKVEEVRVGLLGFRKEVEGLKAKVVEREGEVAGLVDRRVEIGRKTAVGRALVDYEERLKLLEERLMVESTERNAVVDSDDSEEDEDEEAGAYSMSIEKLRKHVLQYQLLRQMEKSTGEHPFIAAQVPRMLKVRNTMLLDLSTALQQSKAAGESGKARVVKLLGLYANMDGDAEAVKVLQELKS